MTLDKKVRLFLEYRVTSLLLKMFDTPTEKRTLKIVNKLDLSYWYGDGTKFTSNMLHVLKHVAVTNSGEFKTANHEQSWIMLKIKQKYNDNLSKRMNPDWGSISVLIRYALRIQECIHKLLKFSLPVLRSFCIVGRSTLWEVMKSLRGPTVEGYTWIWCPYSIACP